MKENKIVELLRSGDFTIAYHDNGYACLYKGKFDYDSLPKKELSDFDGGDIGYAPNVVVLLVAALGGKIDSI
jgi:hypothetical protein